MIRRLTIATCQFPVTANIQENERYIRTQLKESKVRGADISHFSASSLSGYAGIDFVKYDNHNKKLLEHSLTQIKELVSELS